MNKLIFGVLNIVRDGKELPGHVLDAEPGRVTREPPAKGKIILLACVLRVESVFAGGMRKNPEVARAPGPSISEQRCTVERRVREKRMIGLKR